MMKVWAMIVGAVVALTLYWACSHIRGARLDNEIKAFQLERMKVQAARADAEYERKELARKQKEADEREYAERRIKEIGGAK